LAFPNGIWSEVALALGRTPETLEGWQGEGSIQTFSLMDYLFHSIAIKKKML